MYDMNRNPFDEEIEYDTFMEDLDKEIQIRLARESLEEYASMVYPNYKHTKFHHYLCGKIQEFLNTEHKGVSFLLLSVPPQ
jgi:hypothetical protein